MSSIKPNSPPSESAIDLESLPYILPPQLLVRERDMLADYLSEDLERVCAVAIKYDDPVMKMMASGSLETRRDVYEIWRTKMLDSLAASVHGFADLLNDPELGDKIRSGSMPLIQVDHLLKTDRDERQQIADEARELKKAAMTAAFVTCVADARTDYGHGANLPQWLVITGDGESGLFRKRSNAVDFGKSKNFDYYLMAVDTASSRRFYAH